MIPSSPWERFASSRVRCLAPPPVPPRDGDQLLPAGSKKPESRSSAADRAGPFARAGETAWLSCLTAAVQPEDALGLRPRRFGGRGLAEGAERRGEVTQGARPPDRQQERVPPLHRPLEVGACFGEPPGGELEFAEGAQHQALAEAVLHLVARGQTREHVIAHLVTAALADADLGERLL